MMCLLAVCLLMFLVAGAKNGQPSELMANPCQCVPPHMCIDSDLDLKGQGLLDIRTIDGECENSEDICCDNVIQSKSTEPPKALPSFNQCGIESPLTTRVLGDETIVFGEVPWTAAILIKDIDTKLNIFQCGCSLIHAQVVLTAAHCVAGHDPDSLTIIAGELDTEDTFEVLPHQERLVKEIVTHQKFNSVSLNNDIALVFLTEPFSLSVNTKVVCLPSMDSIVVEKSCRASGWGADSFSNGKHSTRLKKIDLPLISRKECTTELRNTRLGPFFNLHRSFICAGNGDGKDTCIGDGGSPLVCQLDGQPNRFVQMGIVSWGIGCGGAPGVYVNVNFFSSWIDIQIKKRKLDINTYKQN